MQEVKYYSSNSLTEITKNIEKDANRMNMKIVNVSLSSEKAGYDVYHYAIVVFEK